MTLDAEIGAAHAQRLGLAADAATLSKDPSIRAIVESAVAQANAKLSRVEQIKKFTILPDYWEPGTDVLTPTMKLRRRPIADRYAATIDELYA